MEMMRAEWTDKRLDEFVRLVDQRFDRIEGDIRELRVATNALREEMNTRFDAVNERFDAINERFDTVNGRFDAMQRLIARYGGGAIVTLIVGFVAVIAK